MRKDALRNRQRLMDAADAMFRAHGIDVSITEIAAAAGIGRGTLFRNFATKDALIAAIVTQRIEEAIHAGRDLLASDADDAELVFAFVSEVVKRQQENRALLQAITDDILCVAPELQRVHNEFLDVFAEMLERGKRAGSVRPEATPADLMMLMKGLCMEPPTEGPLKPETVVRHLDLLRAALTTPAYSRPLRGDPQPLRH